MIAAGCSGICASHLQRDIAFTQQPLELLGGPAADANENPTRMFVVAPLLRTHWAGCEPFGWMQTNETKGCVCCICNQ